MSAVGGILADSSLVAALMAVGQLGRTAVAERGERAPRLQRCAVSGLTAVRHKATLRHKVKNLERTK